MADEADDLYALPLEEFTQARNELAKRLKDPSIKELKKPSVSAWAANQLARTREVDVRRLLRAGERLEQAQRGIVGGGDQNAFVEAQREERDAVRRLRSEAAQILRDAGHPASDATLERLAATLHAAAATEEGRTVLRGGRLIEDLEPLGFGALHGFVAPPAGRGKRSVASTPATPKPRPDGRLEKARAELAAARQEAEATEKEAKAAERDADRARRAADRAAERAARLESRVRDLRRD
jgi:hypothetical protein